MCHETANSSAATVRAGRVLFHRLTSSQLPVPRPVVSGPLEVALPSAGGVNGDGAQSSDPSQPQISQRPARNSSVRRCRHQAVLTVLLGLVAGCSSPPPPGQGPGPGRPSQTPLGDLSPDEKKAVELAQA